MDIDGRLLRQDREDQRRSRASLLSLFEQIHRYTIHESTLRRAEAGKASRKVASDLAIALGHPAFRYTSTQISHIDSNVHHDLNGEWAAYYLEDDVGTSPYTVKERLFIKQSGSRIEGIYEADQTDHPENYQGTSSFTMNGRIVGDVVFGQYFVEQSSLPRGFGVFQLFLMRNGDWAEGYCNFFADDNKIMNSPNIWARKTSHQFTLMCQQAERYMKSSGHLLKAPFTV